MKNLINQLDTQLKDLKEQLDIKIPDMFDTLKKIELAQETKEENEKDKFCAEFRKELEVIISSKAEEMGITDDDLPDWVENFKNQSTLEELKDLIK